MVPSSAALAASGRGTLAAVHRRYLFALCGVAGEHRCRPRTRRRARGPSTRRALSASLACLRAERARLLVGLTHELAQQEAHAEQTRRRAYPPQRGNVSLAPPGQQPRAVTEASDRPSGLKRADGDRRRRAPRTGQLAQQVVRERQRQQRALGGWMGFPATSLIARP